MVSPLSATRYYRQHPYEDRTYEERTSRLSPSRNYNLSHYSNAYDFGWRPNDSYLHNNYSQFGYNTESYRRRNWNDGENTQPDKYFENAPIANNDCRSLPASTFEKQPSHSRHIESEYLSRNNKDKDSNPLAERNKWSERRSHKTEQASNSCIEDQNKTKPNQWQNHLHETLFSDHDKGYVYDSHYGYARKVRSDEIVSEKYSTKSSKFPKRTSILTCLICSEEVKRRDIHGHLLFGFVQCLSCPWNAKTCKDFSERHKNNYQCSHSKLQWEFSTVDQVSKNLRSINKVPLKDYLDSTIALKYYAPYDFAYNHFQTIVDEMPDEDCEDIPALIDGGFEKNKCHDPASDAGIDSEVSIKGNVTKICNNSEENTNTVLQNLEEFFTFDQFSQPQILQDESESEEINFELVTSKEIVSDTVSKTHGTKKNLESSSSSRTKKKKKKSPKIVSVNDKHQTLIIGAPSEDIRETAKSAVTAKKNEEKEYHSKDRDILPSFVSDNYVLTYTWSDDCPQCYATLNPLEFTVYLKSHIIVAKCEECSLYICFRNKLIDSYKSAKSICLK